MEEKQAVNLWSKLESLYLIQALKSIETERNQIPNIACVEIAERLTAIAVSIEKMKHDFDYQKRMDEIVSWGIGK